MLRQGQMQNTYNCLALDASMLQVCREFRKNMCTRPARDCRYAHPPEHISVDSDYTVTVCMDFVKDKCDRPTCRYYHPLPHIMPRIKQQQQLGAGVPPAFGGVSTLAVSKFTCRSSASSCTFKTFCHLYHITPLTESLSRLSRPSHC